MKRIFLIFILTIFLTPTLSFCDDNLLLEELEPFLYTDLEVSSNEDIITYSKNIAVFDRNSKMLLFDKNSNTPSFISLNSILPSCPTSPLIAFIKVDLPAPFAPNKQVSSPA